MFVHLGRFTLVGFYHLGLFSARGVFSLLPFPCGRLRESFTWFTRLRQHPRWLFFLGLTFLLLFGLSALDVSLCLPGLAFSCQSSKPNKPRNTTNRSNLHNNA
ncbi:hypothetical protein FKP32DRAFT_66808 [Trametes sanguinea]|nr:hypothetical protein FKP32DRAFT_66808 [Trametes sanguinea]